MIDELLQQGRIYENDTLLAKLRGDHEDEPRLAGIDWECPVLHKFLNNKMRVRQNQVSEAIQAVGNRVYGFAQVC
jgi:hypothetical protein